MSGPSAEKDAPPVAGLRQVWCVVHDSETPNMDGSHSPRRMADQSYEQAVQNYEFMLSHQKPPHAPKRNLRIETRWVSEYTCVLSPGEVPA